MRRTRSSGDRRRAFSVGRGIGAAIVALPGGIVLLALGHTVAGLAYLAFGAALVVALRVRLS